jgi:hypothetical protein
MEPPNEAVRATTQQLAGLERRLAPTLNPAVRGHS